VPAESDLGLVADAAHAGYGDWLAGGVKLFEYTAAMLHSKYAVVDDDWCTVGTFNANPPSLGWANEANVFVFDPAFVGRVARLFARDLRSGRPVARETLGGRPALLRARELLASGIMNLVEIARPGSK
jgi:cardiolipin synthase